MTLLLGLKLKIHLNRGLTTDACYSGFNRTPAHRASRKLVPENSGAFVAITAIFWQLEESVMRTKTAIISIENLRTEDLPKLKDALQAVPGVGSVEFSVERSVAVLEFDPSQAHIDDFLRVILKAGFQVL